MTLRLLLCIILMVLTEQQIEIYAKNGTKFGNVSYANSTKPIIEKISTASDNSKRDNSKINSYERSSEMVIGNCSYENTINITELSLPPNGSYIYDNQIIIPPDLVRSYDYEILYNGRKVSVPQHKRACICHMKPCITLCSNHIPEVYNYFEEHEIESFEMFSIDITLSNQEHTVVKKHILKDFIPIVLHEFCDVNYILSPELSYDSNWALLENGSLSLYDGKKQLKRGEYCFDIHQIEYANITYDLINPKVCANKRKKIGALETINNWIEVVSIIFLISTIITYCCLPIIIEVHDKLFILYASNLAVSFTIFSFTNLSEITFSHVPCLLMAYVNHFTQLSLYTWLGIICFDIYKRITKIRNEDSCLKYFLYGFTLPLLMTLFALVVQNSDIVEDAWKPGINIDNCGLDTHRWSAIIYLYGPCFIILICCSISFISICWKATQSKKVLRQLEIAIPGPVFCAPYWLLLHIMAICWFLDILSYLLYGYDLLIASTIIDFINSLQGVYVFAIFIGREEIRNLIKEKYNKMIYN